MTVKVDDARVGTIEEIQHALDRNAPVTIISGGKRVGKTTFFFKLMIDTFINHRHMSQYLRKTDEKLKQQLKKGDILYDLRPMYPHHILRMEGNRLMVAKKPDDYDMNVKSGKKIALDWEQAAVFSAVSTLGGGNGSTVGDFAWIIYDEFDDIGNDYFRGDEYEFVINMWINSDNFENKCRLVLVSNAVSVANTFFAHWGIDPRLGSRWYNSHSQYFAMIDNQVFKNKAKDSWIGKIIENTDYGDMVMDNQYPDDNQNLIRKVKPQNLQPMAKIVSSMGDFIFYRIKNSPSEYYIDMRSIRVKNKITSDTAKISEDTVFEKKSGHSFSVIRNRLKIGKVFFPTAACREYFISYIFSER